MQFKNNYAFTVNLISYNDKIILSNIWGKIVENVNVNVFSTVKVNQAHCLLSPHLLALKIESFLSKMLLLQTSSTFKRIKCEQALFKRVACTHV